MTQEEKQLLLQDLCARLPYHPILNWKFIDNTSKDEELRELSDLYIWWITKAQDCEARPYLRPLSSMTVEEKRELMNTTQYDTYYKDDGIDCIYQHILGWEIQGRITINNVGYSTIDWLNEHHFDYRGLIEKGLALEAPEDMYKF